MTVYREFDNTVKMHRNTHSSVHTSQRDDFILFSYNSPQGPRSKFPCAIVASFELLGAGKISCLLLLFYSVTPVQNGNTE